MQDVMWLDTAADKIRQVRFPAYFVPRDNAPAVDATNFFAILLITEEFRQKFDAAWRHLTKSDSFKIQLFDDADDAQPAEKWFVTSFAYNVFVSNPDLALTIL